MALPTEEPPAAGFVWCVYCDVWTSADDMRVIFGSHAGNPYEPTPGVAVSVSVGAPWNCGICADHTPNRNSNGMEPADELSLREM